MMYGKSKLEWYLIQVKISLRYWKREEHISCLKQKASVNRLREMKLKGIVVAAE